MTFHFGALRPNADINSATLPIFDAAKLNSRLIDGIISIQLEDNLNYNKTIDNSIVKECIFIWRLTWAERDFIEEMMKKSAVYKIWEVRQHENRNCFLVEWQVQRVLGIELMNYFTEINEFNMEMLGKSGDLSTEKFNGYDEQFRETAVHAALRNFGGMSAMIMPKKKRMPKPIESPKESQNVSKPSEAIPQVDQTANPEFPQFDPTKLFQYPIIDIKRIEVVSKPDPKVKSITVYWDKCYQPLDDVNGSMAFSIFKGTLTGPIPSAMITKKTKKGEGFLLKIHKEVDYRNKKYYLTEWTPQRVLRSQFHVYFDSINQYVMKQLGISKDMSELKTQLNTPAALKAIDKVLIEIKKLSTTKA